MKIVAIEGLDKSGKKTVSDLLVNYFEEHGLSVAHLSFPMYSGPIGRLIRDWLHGAYDADEQTFELLQAADKQQAQTLIKGHEALGTDILVLDRYIHSLWAYGAYDNDERWLQQLTKYMRKPDHVVYLDVEPEVSMHRRGEHGDNDYYESDLERLNHTREEYLCLFKEHQEIPVSHINANNPPLIVKADAFKVASELLHDIVALNQRVSV